MKLPPRHTWPSLANSKAAKAHLGGICGHCRPPRDIVVDIAELIERYGPDAKTRDVSERITCRVCGHRVAMSLMADNVGPPRE